MINPFNIHKNKRYTLGGRTIIIEDVLQSSVVWYDLNEWWKFQSIKPKLNKSKKFWFIMRAQKYKFS
jgi:hypothetical protein